MDFTMRKIYVALQMESKRFLAQTTTELMPTTASIANQLEIDRTVASRKLNALFKANKIIKINIRPVGFVALIDGLLNRLQPEYDSVESFVIAYQNEQAQGALHQIIGWNRSLHDQVDQIRAGLMYPNGGLPMIIFGPSGTGKSFMAKCAYQYAQSMSLIDADAPFVTINCAQYANNPELLSSALFGYVKGAFTGANGAKDGALKVANRGILFLDEVHRLSAEGQEKLFTYMDNGYFSPLGDDTKQIWSNCRLIFATTECQDEFLETFLRRVPIKITMPPLQKRSFLEKKQLVNSFLSMESQHINIPIEITGRALNMLYQHNYKSNVGESKNIIKNIVATAYAKKNTADKVEIGIADIPNSLYEDVEEADDGHLFASNNKTLFNGTQQERIVDYVDDPTTVQFNRAWKYIDQMNRQGVMAQNKYIYIVRNLMNHLYFSSIRSENAAFKHTLIEVRDMLKLMQYGRDFYDNNNFVYGISSYMYYLLNLDVPRDDLGEISSRLSRLFEKELNFIMQLQPIIEEQFETSLTERDRLWLAMLIANEDLPLVRDPAIIMAHGYATASSIADTCNELLKYPVFHAIDMLPTASAEEMMVSLQDIIGKIKPTTGLVIMIDMGSLSAISKKVSHFFSYPLLVIDKVSTPVALEVGNQLQQDHSLESIRQKMAQVETNCTFIKGHQHLRNVILATCMTGIGTAEQIRKMLLDSFEGILKVDVISCEFDQLKHGLTTNEKNDYNILAIIGIDNPQVPDIPYLGLEEIISGNKIGVLEQILTKVGTKEDVLAVERQLIKNFSLSRVMDSLTILSPDKVMAVVECYLKAVDTVLPQPMSNKVKIAMYVHLGSMIERLIRGNGIQEYKGDNRLIEKDEIYSVLKKNISVIENEFAIQVSPPEIAYIREIIAY